ncbi:hypothetical protein CBL_12350, partial [Carabus blaptoides fortunei]
TNSSTATNSFTQSQICLGRVADRTSLFGSVNSQPGATSRDERRYACMFDLELVHEYLYLGTSQSNSETNGFESDSIFCVISSCFFCNPIRKRSRISTYVSSMHSDRLAGNCELAGGAGQGG